MGGYFSSPGKGQLTHLLREYKKKQYTLHDAVVGLFNAIDVMDATASSLVHDLQADFECTDQDQKESRLEQYRKLAARLLTTSKYAVAHQKEVTKHHLLSLLDFINKAIIENAKSVEVTFRDLTFANYEDDVELPKSQKKENLIALSLKIEEQTDEMKSLRKKIELLKGRETTYVEAEKVQHEKIKLLEQQALNQSNNFRKDIDEMQTLNDSLNSRLQQADTYKKELDSQTIILQSLQEEHRCEISNYEREITAMKQRIEILNEKKEREEKMQFEKMQLQEQQAKDESNDLRKKIDEMTTINDSLQSQLQQASTYKKDLDSLNITLQSMQEDHRNEISNYVREIKAMKERIEILNKEKEREEKMQLEKMQLLEQQAKDQSNALQKEIDDMKSKNEEIRRQLEDFRHKNESLNQNCERLKDDLRTIKRKSEDNCRKYFDLQQSKSNLEQDKKDKEKLINELIENTEEQEKEINDLKRERVDTSKQHTVQVQNLQKNVESLNQEKEVQLQLNEKLKTYIEEYKAELKRLKDNLEEEKDKKVQVQKLNQNYKTELEKRVKEIEEQKSQNKLIEKETEKRKRNYERTLREKEEYIKNIHEENNKLNETITAEKKSFQHLKQVLKEKETELRSQQTVNTELSTQLKFIRDDLETIQVEYASKKDELELIKSKKIVPVQLYTQKRSELTDNVGEIIIRLLQKEFVSDRLELDFWKCSRISDIRANYPLLVMCVTVSRIGTDVANAIHGIHLSPNMVVMVVHHKDEHALPNQLTERILTGKELKDIGGIFDIAYFSGKGIYPCEMNRNSADSLVTFIKRVARNIHP